MIFQNCYELAQLPYFDLDEQGRLKLTLDDAPPIVDFHMHLGFSFLLSRPIDLGKTTDQVYHCFRLDRLQVDTSLYSGVNLRNTRRNGTFLDYIPTVFTRRGPNSSHTVPNSMEEMDRMGVEKSVVLSLDLPVASKNSEHQLEAVAGNPRFIPFCRFNALTPGWEARMDNLLEMGARGLKIHPYSQMMPPNHPRMLKMLKRWSKTGLPVLFHTSNNGLEPAAWRRLSDMELYAEPLRQFPEITFILGHGGMNRYEIACEMAKAHGNAYLEIGGQPPQNIKHIIELIGNERVLFGTDWPFYPLVLPLAKVLLATEGDKESRNSILSENAFRLIKELRLENTGGRVESGMTAGAA